MNLNKDSKALLVYSITFLILVIGIYLLGSLIAWNFNPSNWWLMGRVLSAIGVVICFGTCVDNLHNKL